MRDNDSREVIREKVSESGGKGKRKHTDVESVLTEHEVFKGIKR